MIKTLKIILGTLIISYGIILASSALAEDNQTAPTPVVSPTPAVQASDLGVKDPRMLPDNPFYFLKEWKRSVQMLLTTNTVNKTELAEKIANEKLIELQKLTEKGVSPELIKKATEKYQQQIERVKNLAEKIKGTAENNPEVNKFLDKFTRQQELHEQILQKLEQQVPAEVLQKIKDARENHLEKFKQVMQKLETRKDQVKEKLDRVCVQLYNPVCGEDGKTYGNECLAKVVGVEIASPDACAIGTTACQTDADCPQPQCGPNSVATNTAPQCNGAMTIKCVDGRCIPRHLPSNSNCQDYYWIDNTNKECGQKQFCGLYMYSGLRTFPTKAQCLRAINATPAPTVSPSSAAQ